MVSDEISYNGIGMFAVIPAPEERNVGSTVLEKKRAPEERHVYVAPPELAGFSWP